MKTTWLIPLLVAACLSSVCFVAQAQTARIAHLSHSGSLAALAGHEAVDNFGLPSTRFTADTIVATSDTTAVAHGRESMWGDKAGVRTTRAIYYGKRAYQHAAATGLQSRGTAVRLLQQRYPEAKLVGFDTLAKPAAAPERQPKKFKKRKPTEGALHYPLPPTPPQHPGLWLALVAIGALVAAGLLLEPDGRPALKSNA